MGILFLKKEKKKNIEEFTGNWVNSSRPVIRMT